MTFQQFLQVVTTFFGLVQGVLWPVALIQFVRMANRYLRLHPDWKIDWKEERREFFKRHMADENLRKTGTNIDK